MMICAAAWSRRLCTGVEKEAPPGVDACGAKFFLKERKGDRCRLLRGPVFLMRRREPELGSGAGYYPRDASDRNSAARPGWLDSYSRAMRLSISTPWNLSRSLLSPA